MFITRGNHAVPVVAHDLEYKSFLAAFHDVQSNDFIIDLYPVDRDPLWWLFVGRFQILSAFRLYCHWAQHWFDDYRPLLETWYVLR